MKSSAGTISHGCLHEPIVIVVKKIFKNISRKVRGGHRLYSGGALLQMINNSGTLFATLISTHIENGAFWDTPEKLLLTSQASQE